MAEHHDLAVTAAQIHLVDHGHALLGAFSEDAHDYAAKVLGGKGVRLHMGTAVTEIGPGYVVFDRRHHNPYPLRRVGRRDQGAGAGRSGRAAGRPRRAH